MGHVTRKISSEMTYNVPSGTLNPTIPYDRDVLMPWSAFGLSMNLRHFCCAVDLYLRRLLDEPVVGGLQLDRSG